MIKIVKNNGQCTAKALQKCKYLLYTDDFSSMGDLYAKVRLSSIFWYVVGRIKGWDRP